MMKRIIVWAAALSLLQASAQEVALGDFTKGEGGWKAAHHTKDVEVSAAGTSFTVTGNDPWFLGPKVSIPGAAADATKRVPPDAVKVRFTIICEPTDCGGAWEIYHNLDGKGYDERKKFALRACGGQPYTQFSAYMPAKGFSSVEGSFRIDPPAVTGKRFTIKSFTAEVVEPAWTYSPATPPPLALPDNSIVLEGDGWRLRHDPSRMGAFRYESHGKTVEGCVGEPCVLENGIVDWAAVKPSVKRTANGFTMTAATRDADGREWRMTRLFAKAESGRSLAIKTTYACDEARVFHVPYLTLFAERGSNGHKHQAMLSGLEYLDDEPSSNTKDIRMPEANRLIPALHRICAPFAAITDDKAYLAAEWEMPRFEEYSVVFDTPDRQFNSGGHLLAFWFPAVGKSRPESELGIYRAEPYSGGAQTVVLRAGEGGTVADALAALVRPGRLPARDRFDDSDALALLSRGWLDTELREGTQMRHALGFALNQASDAPALMKWLAAQIERRRSPDAALVKRLRETAEEMFAAVAPKDIGKTCVSHIQRPVSPLLAGDIDAWIAARDVRLRERAKSLAGGFRTWKKPGPGAKYDYGETLGADDCNGYTAMAMEELLIDATWNGDETAIDAALAALDKALVRYEGTVPRGAQPWEMPLHTPDIIASGLMVRCCALGYLLRPDAKYLKAARYWAYTGLSMVYLAPPPFAYPDGTKPFGCYATCGVMGATQWDLVSWMGRPVQWCGLVYSAALYDYIRLCRPEEAAFWCTVADGIVASGVRQSHPASEPDRQGLLPDSVYIDGQTRNPPAINPGDVQENLSEMLKSPYYALRAFPGATPALLHMAGDATKLERKGNALSCRIAAWPETESRLVLTRIDAVASVSLDGRQLPFSYDAARRIAVATLPPRAEGECIFRCNGTAETNGEIYGIIRATP